MIPRPLPEDVSNFLKSQQADQRLVNHLVIVHDTCCQLIDALHQQFPGLTTDRETIRFGAALHDAGKILHSNEIYEAGRRHEDDGPQFLLEHGFPPAIASFAKTHGSWDGDPNLPLNDLLVALSDAIWKGARIEPLETLVAQRIADQTGREVWDCWMKLDEVLANIAKDADERLAWQGKK